MKQGKKKEKTAEHNGAKPYNPSELFINANGEIVNKEKWAQKLQIDLSKYDPNFTDFLFENW